MSNDVTNVPPSPLLRKQGVYLRANVKRGKTVIHCGTEYEVVATYPEFHDAVRIRSGSEEQLVTRPELVTKLELAQMQQQLDSELAAVEREERDARIAILQPVIDLYKSGVTDPKEIAAKLGYKNEATAWSRVMEAKKLKLIEQRRSTT